MTSIDHMHEEAKMLPIHDHLSLIISQCLPGALQPNNPSHSVVTSPSGIRNKKEKNLSISVSQSYCSVSIEANLLRPYRTALSQLRASFCSSLRSYRERIGIIPIQFCPSWGVERYTTVHVFSYSSHHTPLTEIELWEHPSLMLEFLFGMFDLPTFPPPPSEPPPSGGQES